VAAAETPAASPEAAPPATPEVAQKPAPAPAVAPEAAVVAKADAPAGEAKAAEALASATEAAAPVEIAASRSEPASQEIVPAYYEVRRGDTLSRIAARFGLSERELVARNGLRNRHRIAAGQRLRVAAEASPPAAAASAEAVVIAKEEPAAAQPAPEAAAPAAAQAEAAAPEPPDEPAVAVGAEETAIAAGLVPGAEDARVAEAVVAEVAPAAPAGAPRSAAPDPSDYAVTPDQRITVHADETIGHYAEWLEVSASLLRQINGMRRNTPLVIGRQRKLDFSRVSPEVFEQRRLEYHRTLQEEFFEAYEVTSTTTHELRRGETLWRLSRERYEIPMWLLVQYNPDLDFGSLSPGTTLVIPVVDSRQSG
jgi:membrane-bound lytic murein transglycosylase D